MPVLHVSCDTTIVIDALEGARPAAVELFAHARAGEIDVAFATRLRHELQRHTLKEVRELVGVPPIMLPTAVRYDVSTYGSGDTYGTEIGAPGLNLVPTSWRLGFAQLGIDTFLGGDPADVSNPTMDAVGKLRTFDSDHLLLARRFRHPDWRRLCQDAGSVRAWAELQSVNELPRYQPTTALSNHARDISIAAPLGGLAW